MEVQIEDPCPKGEGQVDFKKDKAKDVYRFFSHSLSLLYYYIHICSFQFF